MDTEPCKIRSITYFNIIYYIVIILVSCILKYGIINTDIPLNTILILHIENSILKYFNLPAGLDRSKEYTLLVTSWHS